MANYTKVFTKPYEDGYENLPSQNTPITAETLNDKDDAIVNIENYLSENDIPSDAEGLSYDNTDSGLTADNVQSAIDEIVTDIPTTAEDIGYDNTDSGLTADNVQGAVDELADEKVDKTGVDVKTDATGQFNTITGGLMQSCVVDLEPKQSGSGTPSPSNVRAISGHTQVQVGNVGKNRLDSVLDSTSLNGIVCTKNSDGSYTLNGTATAKATFVFFDNVENKYQGMKLVGCPSGGSGSKYAQRFVYKTSGNVWIGEVFDYGNGVIVPTGDYPKCSCVIDIFNGAVINNLVFKPMLTTDTTAIYDDYEPYNGYTTTINLGGTYYGGTLDAVSGVLTVDKGMIDLSTLTWSTISNTRWISSSAPINIKVPASNAMALNGIASNFEVAAIDTFVANDMCAIGVETSSGQYGYLKCRNGSTTNPPTGDLVYELATPLTIQLTPTQLETLVGQNDVFAPLVGQTVESVEYREVLAIDDVPKAIPYECVDPIEVEWFTAFKIHKYGRVVVLKFYDLEYSPVASEDRWVTLGKLPERFYHKYPNPTVAQNMIFGVINDDNGTLQMKQLTIEQYGGNVRMYYLANEQIRPLGSITYILDHD